jgi:hypothetical protein
VFSGVDGSVLYSFIGNFPGNSIGFSVSSAGDVNADGFADLIVAGARVFSGIDGSLLYNFEEDVLGISSSVSGAGDVNGDGFDDLIVGAWSANNYRGSAQVFSGFDGNELYSFEGDSEEDWLGLSVSGAGDVNGDGFADLIVGAAGAWGDDIGSFNIGYARVFSGSDGSGFSGTDEKVLYTFDGDREYDFFGRSVSGVGDVNGDGVADFVVGADTGGADYAGYVRVFVSQITPSVLKGDVDRNGDVDFDDIPAFISVLQAGVFQAEVDCDCSDVVDFADIPAFIAILESQ